MSTADICSKAALRRIIRDLEHIARECAHEHGDESQGECAKSPVDLVVAAIAAESAPGRFTDAELVAHARQIYQTRRKRDKQIGRQFFGEPSWDILLDLFIHHDGDVPVSVTNACIGSTAPQSTALRWLALMEREGLIERYHTPADRRVALLRLTPKGLRLMRDVLSKYLTTCVVASAA